MFKYDLTPKVCRICDMTIGGQPGDNPPLLISSMFYSGDRILESRRDRKFDREKARSYILRQEELSDQTGIPAIVAMTAVSTDEMKEYIDFYLTISNRPFAIDIWGEKVRLDTAEYAANLGIQDKILYNSITPWDKDMIGQAAALKELGIKHAVLQVFDETNQTPSGRVQACREMLKAIGAKDFASVLIDTTVMNLPSISFSALAGKQIKAETGWPVGSAPANGTYMWKESREMWGGEGFSAINAAVHAVSAVLWSDFLFYGPIKGAPSVLPAVAAASLMVSTLTYDESGELPANPNHPLYRFYGDFAQKLIEFDKTK
jgi:tetrahydromethanopterin S-methyltransferase subunit H